ncbi:hypothetical protein [Vreelandella piezotolerans]|uniref:hypothetical protein n=1 Tax=Vreelandella piezotolerans TaxID=2609667 RepID=UPI003796677E
MDDELKAIQADLDDVLKRLANYMSGDKLHTQWIEWGEASKADAAAVILNYADTDNPSSTPMNLDGVIVRFRCARASQDTERNKQIAFHGEEIGEAVAAISALSDSSFVPDSQDLSILSSAAYDFMEGRSKWFGESLGIPTVRALRKKDGETAKPPLVIGGYLDALSKDKLNAAMDVFFIHREKNIPLDEGLFELVGQHRGIKTGTLKAFYYSDKAKAMRKAHGLVEDIRGITMNCCPTDIEI